MKFLSFVLSALVISASFAFPTQEIEAGPLRWLAKKVSAPIRLARRGCDCESVERHQTRSVLVRRNVRVSECEGGQCQLP